MRLWVNTLSNLSESIVLNELRGHELVAILVNILLSHDWLLILPVFYNLEVMVETFLLNAVLLNVLSHHLLFELLSVSLLLSHGHLLVVLIVKLLIPVRLLVL